MSFLPIRPTTLSSQISGVSPSSLAARALSELVPIAAVTLPALGRGLARELGVSSGPHGVGTLDDRDPLDRGGRGNNDPRGDDCPDRRTPLESR